MRSIVLHGALKDEFGGPYPLDVSSPAEAIRALCIMVKGFKDRLREGAYAIVRGKIDDRSCIAEDALRVRLGGALELHIVPVVAGAATSTWLKIIAGVALVAAAVFAPYALGVAGGAFAAGSFGAYAASATIAIGASLALGGVGELLARAPQTNNAIATVDQRQSFLFGGLQNVSAQGGPVPLVYGRTRVGSVMVSAGVTTEQLGIAGAFGGR